MKTAHSASRQTVFNKAVSQVSPTFFSLMGPVVVDFEVKTLCQICTGNRSINLLKHIIYSFFS